MEVVVIGSILGCFLLYECRLVRRLQADMACLLNLVRVLLRSNRRQLLPTTVSTMEGQGLLKGLRALSKKLALLGESQGNFEQILNRGSEVIAVTDELDQAAERLVDLVKTEMKGTVVATALIVGGDFEPRVAYCSGLPLGRVNQPLLMLYDEFAATAKQALFQMRLPSPNDWDDFRKLGIESYYFLPLCRSEQMVGALWIGFRDRTTSESDQDQAKIVALAKHASAVIQVSLKMKARELSGRLERDYLLGVSHDLKAPGHAALYAVRHLLSGEVGELGPLQTERLLLIESALCEQLSLISDVLDVERMKRGLLKARTMDFGPKKLIDDIIDRYKMMAQQKGLKVETKVEEGLTIKFDLQHFQRIMENLISNAIKYSDCGSVLVQSVALPDRIVFEVKDEGIGIPHEELDNLFKSFNRLSNSCRRGGSGLGLAMSHILAETNKATLSYLPNTPGGSIFCLDVCAGEPLPGEYQDKKWKSILVIDDDAALCRTYERYLQGASDNLRVCSDIGTARGLFSQIAPEVVVCDLYLGGQSARELLRSFRELNPRLQILLITGTREPAIIETVEKECAAEVLTKPVSRAELLGKLQALRHGASHHNLSPFAQMTPGV